jgi:hypothetical protein
LICMARYWDTREYARCLKLYLDHPETTMTPSRLCRGDSLSYVMDYQESDRETRGTDDEKWIRKVSHESRKISKKIPLQKLKGDCFFID